MTFDPFGDFETKGYLRNVAREKDRGIVRKLEHAAFTLALPRIFDALLTRKPLTYEDLLFVHGASFDAVYPWAGEDRITHAAHLAITKGENDLKVRFADPPDIRRSIDWALSRGQDNAFMASNPGTIMGYLPFGHPFLDGNGRAIMALHCVLAQRAGISLDWACTEKTAYLTALTYEINDPDRGHLDAYLKPFVRSGLHNDKLASNILSAAGLDGEREDTVAGSTDDPQVKAEYEAQKLKRKSSLA